MRGPRRGKKAPRPSLKAPTDAFAEKRECRVKGRLRMPITLTRRRFLTTPPLVGVAGLAPLLQALAAEGSLETTTVQLSKDFAICEAPLDVAYELLRAEGFTDIRYVDTSADEVFAAVARRKVDFALDFPVLFVPAIDSGEPITVLAGVHVGCFELFARDDVRSIADLRGKTVGLKASPPALLRLMAAQVGLDSAKDIHWVSAGTSGTARTACRPRHPQHGRRSSMVAILLLHGVGQSRMGARIPGCNQARTARDPQS